MEKAEDRWAALVETMLAQGEATYGSEGPQRAFGSTSHGRLMKERLDVESTAADVWLALASEAEAFVAGRPRPD